MPDFTLRQDLQHLESRCVPAATFIYSAGTLTIVPEEGEKLFVGNAQDAPPGYLGVTSVQSYFNSTINNQPVNNIIVKMGAINSGTISLNSQTYIPGSVTIFGAKQSTTVETVADIGKNFTFQAAASSTSNSVTLSNFGSIGGNATIKLGNGSNGLYVKGCPIGGNLVATGGAGNDTLVTASGDDVVVNGSATINLGGGFNQVYAGGNHLFHVGKDFTYTGGAGVDQVELSKANLVTLDVGGNMKVSLGATNNNNPNLLTTKGVSVGGKLTLTAGSGTDTVDMTGSTSVGGAWSINLGDGYNKLTANHINVGSAFNYTGGLDGDYLTLDAFHVGKALSVDQKGTRHGEVQHLLLGYYDSTLNSVLGSISLMGTGVSQNTVVNRTTIGGNLNIKFGDGFDSVALDDTSVIGATVIAMGGGADTLSLDNRDSDGGGNLPGVTSFGGTFTFKGGAGNDTVELSNSGGTYIQFGGKVSLFGGVGTDEYKNTAFNKFFSPDNIEDFETDTGMALPA
jgi:hypothetical protein